MKTFKQGLAEKLTKAVERNAGTWECIVLGMAEPEMPAEILLEEME